jgi:hypothetical protein
VAKPSADIVHALMSLVEAGCLPTIAGAAILAIDTSGNSHCAPTDPYNV